MYLASGTAAPEISAIVRVAQQAVSKETHIVQNSFPQRMKTIVRRRKLIQAAAVTIASLHGKSLVSKILALKPLKIGNAPNGETARKDTVAVKVVRKAGFVGLRPVLVP